MIRGTGNGRLGHRGMPRQHGRVVLVAGEDRIARGLVAMRVARLGAEVAELTTGEALARSVLAAPDTTTCVVVGDLPDGTGPAFTRWLRDDFTTARTPIAVLAGPDRHEVAADARDAGADLTVVMPADLDETARAIIALAPPTVTLVTTA